jgi:hypothetical protein
MLQSWPSTFLAAIKLRKNILLFFIKYDYNKSQPKDTIQRPPSRLQQTD